MIFEKIFKILLCRHYYLQIRHYLLELFFEYVLSYTVEKVLIFSQIFCCRKHYLHLDYCNIQYLNFSVRYRVEK